MSTSKPRLKRSAEPPGKRRAKREPMSRVDTAWLRMERPTNPMMITGVMMFADRPLLVQDLSTIREFVLRAIDKYQTGGGTALYDALSDSLEKLKKACINNENIFAELMNAARVCSLGQVTHALFEVGGQYRRSM